MVEGLFGRIPRFKGYNRRRFGDSLQASEQICVGFSLHVGYLGVDSNRTLVFGL